MPTRNLSPGAAPLLAAIPCLDDYGISKIHGFLPDRVPLRRLPDPHYNQWESVVENLQALILTQRLRPVIETLPVLKTDGLIEEQEWRRAYHLLAFMAHGYIWNGDKPADRLPPSVSVPFLEVSEHLGIVPVATYAAVCLWNWKTLLTSEGIELNNLATLATFNGSLDESWFYLVSVAVEAKGGPTIELMLNAVRDARNDDVKAVTAALVALKGYFVELHAVFDRMMENCDPHIFYYHIRPFLSGSKDMEHAGLPKGVLYDTGNPNTDTYRKYSGGSNAQSSLIQFFDIILGITHLPTGQKAHGCPMMGGHTGAPAHCLAAAANGQVPPIGHAAEPQQRQAFIQEMRDYMPGDHRRFLEHVTVAANLRPYVESHDNNSELRKAYDAACKALADWRSSHLKVVSRYVTVIAAKKQDWIRNDTGGEKKNLAQASKGEKDLVGTGGTALMPFLRQARDETLEPTLPPPKPAAPGWGWKSFLTTKAGVKRPTNEEKPVVDGEGEVETLVLGAPFHPAVAADPKGHNGMAGTWEAESEGYGSGGGGGLCTY